MEEEFKPGDRVYDIDFKKYGVVTSRGVCEYGYYDVTYDDGWRAVVHKSELVKSSDV